MSNVYNLSEDLSSPEAQPFSILRSISVGIILASINVLTIAGNSLVIYAVATTPRLQNVTNLFVSSLAFADLLLGATVLPCSVIFEISSVGWPLGSTACKIWLSVDILLCTASILNLCIISLDRYFAITRPLVYSTRRSKKLAFGMIAVVWALSSLITFPPLLGWTDHKWNDGNCSVSLHRGYRVYSALGSFFVPFCVMIFVYCNIFLVARKRRHLLKQPRGQSLRKGLRMVAAGAVPSRTVPRDVNCALKVPSQPQGSKNDQEDEDEDSSDSDVQESSRLQGGEHTAGGGERAARNGTKLQRMIFKSGNLNHIRSLSTTCAQVQKPLSNDAKILTARQEKLAYRREHKAAKTLAGVVGCFSLCWLPFFIAYLTEAFCACSMNGVLLSCVSWLGYANSVFNPFIYAFYNKEYSQAFKRILTQGPCRNSARRRSHSNEINWNNILAASTSANITNRRAVHL